MTNHGEHVPSATKPEPGIGAWVAVRGVDEPGNYLAAKRTGRGRRLGIRQKAQVAGDQRMHRTDDTAPGLAPRDGVY